MCPALVNKILDDFKLLSEGTAIKGLTEAVTSQNGNQNNEEQSQYLGSDAKTKGIKNVVKGGSKGNDYANLRGNLLLQVAFSEMVNSSSFKHKLVKATFVDMLAHITENGEKNKSAQSIEFIRCTFSVIESIAKHSKIIN